MTQFHLITGFLGSGKTTFLSKILKELASSQKVAVIQNEFSPTGFDGKELQLRMPGFKLVEINNGSVFCVCQLSNFRQTLLTLITDYAPEQIFLETSGLADPISVVELLQVEELKDKVTLGHIISLVDAANFFKGLNGLVRFKHQVMVSDKVILNKADLAGVEMQAVIQKEIKQMNPFAEIITAVYANIPWAQCLSTDSSMGRAAIRYKGKESAGQPDIKCCVLRSHDTLDEKMVRSFIEKLQLSCPRIKGFLNLTNGKVVTIHSVYDHLEIKMLDSYQGPTELIAFGENISITNLRKRFRECVNN